MDKAPVDTIPSDTHACSCCPTGRDGAATTPEGTAGDPTRRAVLVGAAAVGAATLLAACGGSDTAATPSSSAATPSSSPSAASTGSAAALVATSAVPVGGAVLSTVAGPDGKPVVVSQPTAGTFVGHSSTCTHKGCAVAVQGQQLVCPCHGSVFAIDGSVVNGPAASPLATVAVKVDGDSVVLA